MSGRVSIGEAFAQAAEQHSWNSQWTSDRVHSRTLSECLTEAEEQTPSAEHHLFFDGHRIIRREADIQDWKTLFYLAAARCGSCGRFIEESPEDAKGESIVLNRRCIGCISAGVITPSLFRQ